jgi:general secretion pathway protein G
MLKGARGRRGFTLIETVVTVGIVATLAAVVVPQVVKQFDAADPTRAAEDLNTLRTAIEVFGVNVAPLQPGDVEDLANRIADASASELSVLGAQYTATDEANWVGPYLGFSIPSTAAVGDTVLLTGFDARILNEFARFDADDVDPVGGDSTNIAGVANADFLAIRVYGLSGAAFDALNETIDGPNELSVTAGGTVSKRTTGRLRCPFAAGNEPTADAAVCPLAYYLAVPIRQ